jgi:hypothetical protein
MWWVSDCTNRRDAGFVSVERAKRWAFSDSNSDIHAQMCRLSRKRCETGWVEFGEWVVFFKLGQCEKHGNVTDSGYSE